MRVGFNETCLDHETGPRHPETADRLKAVRQALNETHGARFAAPSPADPETIELAHEPAYVNEIREFCQAGGGALDSDTVASEGTWAASLASAGLAVWAAETARTAEDANDLPFALCRPPGHHALVDQAMGFCIFNNVAIAAEAALKKESSCVGIIDWDVHHGNGTQALFADRPDVPFASIHEEGLYPGTGDSSETGEGPGEGATLNVPMQPGANTNSYLAAVDELVTPWIRRHAPDLLLVSAGFDAHRHDPISRMAVSTEGYGVLTQRVLSLAADIEAEIGFVLEGGYGLDTLSESVTMVNEVCSGYEPTAPADAVRDLDRERLEGIKAVHGLGS